MLYRIVGNTGIEVSALGFGTMRFKDADNAAEIIECGLESGITYFDIGSAYSYRSFDENAETWVGRAIKGRPRDKMVLSAKAQCRSGDNPQVEKGLGIRNRDEMWQCIENSLKRVGVEWFDFYQFWAINGQEDFEAACVGDDAPLKALREAREQGLIRHLGFTSHAKPHEIIEWLKKVPDFRTITIYYNFMDLYCEEVIDFAHRNGVGVKIMGPLRGGLLVGQSEVFSRHLPELANLSVHEIAFRFLLSYEGISCVLSGMNEIEHLKENVEIFSRGESMTPEQRNRFVEAFKELTGGEPLCTGCRYCLGVCPQGLTVHMLMGYYQGHEIFKLPEATKRLASIHKNARLDPNKCVKCEKCVEVCPQKLPIPERMERLVKINEELRREN